MALANTRSNRQDIYDDYMEPLSSIKRQYRRFTLSTRSFSLPGGAKEKEDFWMGMSGGIPVLGEEEQGCVYVDHQDSHTLVLGATGSKKTRLVVMPTVRLLGWAGESMVISDPKAEIYNRTAMALEKEGYRVVVLNFRNPANGNGWNPLSIPYRFYQEGNIDRACEMVNDIARNLLAAEENNKDPFWQDSAANLFFGLVLTLFKMCTEDGQPEMAVNIGNVLKLRRQLFDGKQPSMSLIWNYVKEDEIIAPALSGIVLTAEDTRAGIVSTFDQKVRHFVFQPNLLDMLANNTVRIDDICESRTAVFLIMPDEKTTFHTLISLFIKQSYEYLIYKAQETVNGRMKIRLNYILDEFSSLPTIRDFPAMITAARSRNIRFCLIVQSKHQLNQRYGDETETIQSNCSNWIFLTSREVPLLEEISTLCGKIQEGKLPLVSVFALQHLDKDGGQALMLCGRNRPYYAFLPDIDRYDEKQYEVRGLERDQEREERIEIDGIAVAGKLCPKRPDDKLSIAETAGAVDMNILFSQHGNPFMLEADEEEEQDPADEADAFLAGSQEYSQKMDEGFASYENGDFAEAAECFISAVKKWPDKARACNCENNLGYMLRRGEISEVVIDGISYDIPELLNKGVNEEKPFFLVNMALYVSIMGDFVDMRRGNCYLKRLDRNMAAAVRTWWEKLAQQGELEGYIVLYWLYAHHLIEESEMGKEEIIQILNERFDVEPEEPSWVWKRGLE